ncbi:MAG: hypothetical protein JNK90_14795 [Planctomycetaceae bacterium]|nr:hypothetical protein [Planctomycetaceae bacterium]
MDTMTLGAHYFFAHPRLAFTVHGITAIALGYISNLVQQHWYPDSQLGLHIAVWWVTSILWLLYIAKEPKVTSQPESELRNFASHLRLHALMFGDSASFHDAQAEQDEDYPKGTPLFRSICLSIQGWRLSSLTVSPDTGEQIACLTGTSNAQITLLFNNWDYAWYIGIIKLHANENQTRDFLIALHSVTSHIDGLTKIKWYDGDSDVFHAQMSNEEIEMGAASPVAPEK